MIAILKNVFRRVFAFEIMIPISLLVVSFYSIFLRDIKLNYDDRIYLYLVSKSNAEQELLSEYQAQSKDGAYFDARIKYLRNYPIQTLIVSLLRLTNTNGITSAHEVFLVSAGSVFAQAILVSLLLFWFLRQNLTTKQPLSIVVMYLLAVSTLTILINENAEGKFIGSAWFLQKSQQFVSSGLGDAPGVFDIIGPLLAAGLDFGIVVSTPRGAATLTILLMWCYVRDNRIRPAAFLFVATCLIHVSYGVIALILWCILGVTDRRSLTQQKQFRIYTRSLTLLSASLAQWFSIYNLAFVTVVLILILLCNESHSMFIQIAKSGDNRDKIFRLRVLSVSYLFASVLGFLLQQYWLPETNEALYWNSEMFFVIEYLERFNYIISPILCLEICSKILRFKLIKINFIGIRFPSQSILLLCNLVVFLVFTSLGGRIHESFLETSLTWEMINHPFMIISLDP